MRIRSILPDFWRSEDIEALDWHHRLIFISLWSYVDDNGVGRDNARLITSDVFPLSRDPRETLARVSNALDALENGGQIVRYQVGGRPYLFIAQWDLYQRVDRPGKERYPRPTSENTRPRETLATPSRDTRETHAPGEGEKGRRGEGEKVKDLPAEPDGFGEFYAAYPRKGARARALKAYKTALKKTTPDTLLTAAKAYATARKGEDPKFTPEAAPWLNGERWDDPPPTAHRTPGASFWDNTITQP
jgi:hypothetical protein